MWLQLLLFHDGGPHYVETSPLICSGNQWTGFYWIVTFVMKELINFSHSKQCNETEAYLEPRQTSMMEKKVS